MRLYFLHRTGKPLNVTPGDDLCLAAFLMFIAAIYQRGAPRFGPGLGNPFRESAEKINGDGLP